MPSIIESGVEIVTPEHGFLPGQKFPIYHTTQKFDFRNQSVRVELIDNRFNSKLAKVDCSSLQITNKSEFKSPLTIFKIKEYVNSIFSESNLEVDSSSIHKIQISLEAIDSRLIGYGSIRVHGLCQLKIRYNSLEALYCSDIVDGDRNSPLKSNAFVTRKTASRFMTSAAIRECLEQFLLDLERELPH